MERAQHADDSDYQPPMVEDLETEGEGATVSVTGGAVGSGVSFALAEPTDNPPEAGGA